MHIHLRTTPSVMVQDLQAYVTSFVGLPVIVNAKTVGVVLECTINTEAEVRMTCRIDDPVVKKRIHSHELAFSGEWLQLTSNTDNWATATSVTAAQPLSLELMPEGGNGEMLAYTDDGAAYVRAEQLQ